MNATSPVEAVMDEAPLTEAVLLLVEGEPDGLGGAVWRPAASREEVYDGNFGLNDRLHLGALDWEDAAGCCGGGGSAVGLLHERYPPRHPLLPRVIVLTQVRGDWKNRRWFVKEATVKAVADADYRGDSWESLCEVAEALGSCVFSNMDLRPVPEGGYTSRPTAEDYLDEGCYYQMRNWQEGDPGKYEDKVHELVHDPEVAGQRVEAAAARSRKSRATLGGRSCAWITMDEMQQPMHVMWSFGQRYFWLSDWYSFSERAGRGGLIGTWEGTVHMFNTIFGRNAHRQLEAFQKFMVLWRKHGKATWKNFDAGSGYGKCHKELFSWFDQEATVKFRKKKNHNFDGAVDYRLKDLPHHRRYNPDE